MKKSMKRVFAILMTLAIAITAIPTMEVKAAEGYTVVSASLPVDTLTMDNENASVSYEGAEFEITGIDQSIIHLSAVYFCESTDDYVEVILYESDVANIYRGNVYCDADVESGTYVLDYVLIFFENNSSARIYENIPSSSVTVVNNITDHIAPEMIGFAFEQDGQTFTQGTDSVIEFTAEDIFDNVGGTGIYFDNLDGRAIVHLNSNDDTQVKWAYFVQETDGTYKASIDVDSFTNSEWYVNFVEINDRVGNHTIYDFVAEGIYYNFFVKNSEGECNSSRNITVNFYNEVNELIKTEEVSADTGEVVLAEFLEEIPTYEMELGFSGWECVETEQMLEEDTVFIAASTENEFNFYPVPAKRYVEVDLLILDEDGEYNWTGYEPYIIESDATFQDLITLLPTPESVNGANFVEWDLDEYKLTDIIENDWVDLWAVYDKQIIDVWYNYMNEDGELEDRYKTLIYPVNETVTYEMVLNAIPKHETYAGVTFVKWNIISEDVADITQEVESTYVDLWAVYDKYPVTIDRTYVDTTGAVKNEKITKLYPAGTTMESIYNEYTVTPSDASTSLAITEWRVDIGNPEEVSVENNVLVLTAQYGNENIVEVTYAYIAPFDDHGEEKYETVKILVDNDIAMDEEALFNYCKQSVEDKINVSHYEACGFEGWEYDASGDVDGDGNIDYVSADSVLNEEEIIMVMAELLVGSIVKPCLYVYVAEPGEAIVLPWTYNDYYLEWYEVGEELDGYTYVVPEDAVKGDMFTVVANDTKALPGKADTSVEIIDDNKVLPEGVALRAILLEDGDVVTTTKTLLESKIKDINNLAIYDITLVNTNGVLIEELEDAIKVTLDIPFSIEAGSTIDVFRVDGDELVQCNASISGNKLSFATDHFSTYVFVEQKQVPDTGDNTNVLPYMTLLLFGAGVFMVGYKRRNYVR